MAFAAVGEVVRVEFLGTRECPGFGATRVGAEASGVAGAGEVADTKLGGGERGLDRTFEITVVLQALTQTTADDGDGAALAGIQWERGGLDYGCNDVGLRVVRTPFADLMAGKEIFRVVAGFIFVAEPRVVRSVVLHRIGVHALDWNQVFTAHRPQNALQREPAHRGDAEIIRVTQRRGENTGGFFSPIVGLGPSDRIGERVFIEVAVGGVIGSQGSAAQQEVGISRDGITAALDMVEPRVGSEGGDTVENHVIGGIGIEENLGQRVVAIGEMSVMRDPFLSDQFAGEVTVTETMDKRGVGLTAPCRPLGAGFEAERMGGRAECDDGFAGFEEVEHALEGGLVGSPEAQEKHHKVGVS